MPILNYLEIVQSAVTVERARRRIKDLIDDEELDDDVTGTETKATAGGLSVSLFIEIFKEIASCARSALRSQQDGRMLAINIQISMQTETDFWVKLQREWQAAKKLFQTQHQRLGALDELVMACSQLRLRQPGEPAAHTKAERLYKLERVEVPVRAAELEEERAAADLDLRDKMAQLRYLLQLQRIYAKARCIALCARLLYGLCIQPDW
uniref:Uncharacterized protein n=1 Tax=Phytophthora ramorum TaxID=164328 RepID=H3HDT1_PHYRM